MGFSRYSTEQLQIVKPKVDKNGLLIFDGEDAERMSRVELYAFDAAWHLVTLAQKTSGRAIGSTDRIRPELAPLSRIRGISPAFVGYVAHHVVDLDDQGFGFDTRAKPRQIEKNLRRTLIEVDRILSRDKEE